MFKIYIDRLADENRELINLSAASDFLGVAEEELSFVGPVAISGEAYLAEDHLVICLKAKVTASIPCTICNTQVPTPVDVENFYATVPLEEISDSIFDYTEELREAILLNTPRFTECKGNCPEREAVKKYLKTPGPAAEVIFPFANLD